MYHILPAGVCFHMSAIMNITSVNIHVQVSMWTYVLILLGIYLELELLGHTYSNYLTF